MNKLQQYEKYKRIDFYMQLACLIIPSIASMVLWNKDLVSAALFITVLWQVLSYILTWAVWPIMYESNKRGLYGISLLVLIIVSLFVMLLMPELKEYYFIAMLVLLSLIIGLYLITTYEELVAIKISNAIDNDNNSAQLNIVQDHTNQKKWDMIGQILCLLTPFFIAVVASEFSYVYYTYITVPIWQLLSYIYNWKFVARQNRSPDRSFYGTILFIIIIALCIDGLLMLINEDIGSITLFATALILLFLSPVLAIWYFLITIDELKAIKHQIVNHSESNIHFI